MPTCQGRVKLRDTYSKSRRWPVQSWITQDVRTTWSHVFFICCLLIELIGQARLTMEIFIWITYWSYSRYISLTYICLLWMCLLFGCRNSISKLKKEGRVFCGSSWNIFRCINLLDTNWRQRRAYCKDSVIRTTEKIQRRQIIDQLLPKLEDPLMKVIGKRINHVGNGQHAY